MKGRGKQALVKRRKSIQIRGVKGEDKYWEREDRGDKGGGKRQKGRGSRK